MTHPTIIYLHNLAEQVKKHHSHPLIQQILQEISGNDNKDKSSRVLEPTQTRDVNPTTQPSQQDEIV